MNCCVPFIPLACLLAGAGPAVGTQHVGQTADDVTRARARAEAGEYEQVVKLLEPILDAQPDYAVYHLLGEAYYHTGNPPQARRCLQAAIELKPTNSQNHYLLGSVYLAEGKFALAAEAYQAAQRLGLDTAELHYELATACYHLENYTGRMETRTVLGGLAGRIQDGCYLIDPVPGQRDRFFIAPQGSAIYHLQRALDGGLDTPEVRLLQADIWLGARQHSRALAIYRKIETEIPAADRARYYYHYAQACLGTDDLEGYLDRLQRAIALDKAAYGHHLVTAYRRVADYHNAQGDLDNYIRYLTLAADESPTSADLHYLLGNALYEAGHKLEASRRWRLTLELHPDHPDRTRMLELTRLITSQR